MIEENIVIVGMGPQFLAFNNSKCKARGRERGSEVSKLWIGLIKKDFTKKAEAFLSYRF